MKKSSIFFSITVIFTIASIGVFIAYLSMIEYDKQKYTLELNERYSIVSRVSLVKLLEHNVDEQFEKELKLYKMQVIKDDANIKSILANGEYLQKISARIGSSSIIYFKKNNYLLIESIAKKAVLLHDKRFKPYIKQLMTIRIIFGGILLTLFGAYFWTVRKILPIKKLKREIDKFASGDLNIDCQMNTDDEIAEVANAFTHAVDEIKKLNNSRRLFLRNIMHELKTPITKGRITAEMVGEEKQKKRLISVFEKLDSLLDEFIAIEQVTVDGSFIHKSIVQIDSMIDEAIEILMANPDSIEIEYQNVFELKADFKLLSLAIKNLIDNAIKYSTNSKVKIKVSYQSISFASKGKKMEHDLSYYIEPFTRDSKNSAHGFGLGLYIVDSILKAHNMKLVYSHDSGINYFKIEGFVTIF
ncbi:MAG TPA: HAMP domain-containing histidine kinase [Campylobacterales bacterium]|nr:HAMP domain-containing histidine kinase [Campylobacterales bacterium]